MCQHLMRQDAVLPSFDLVPETSVLCAPYYNFLPVLIDRNPRLAVYHGTWYACFDAPPGLQTAGWNTVGDKDGVPVWAADTLAFKGAGAKLKVGVALHGGQGGIKAYYYFAFCDLTLMLVLNLAGCKRNPLRYFYMKV